MSVCDQEFHRVGTIVLQANRNRGIRIIGQQGAGNLETFDPERHSEKCGNSAVLTESEKRSVGEATITPLRVSNTPAIGV
jgi:hypothetical protein